MFDRNNKITLKISGVHRGRGEGTKKGTKQFIFVVFILSFLGILRKYVDAIRSHQIKILLFTLPNKTVKIKKVIMVNSFLVLLML